MLVVRGCGSLSLRRRLARRKDGRSDRLTLVALSSPDELRVRHVREWEAEAVRQLRLASLASDPDGFGSTYARDAARPSGWWKRWAEQSETGVSQRTFVLVGDADRWLGIALVRLDGENRGTAVLNAMWVSPEARGHRGAGLLCEACAEWAAGRGCYELVLAVVQDNDAARRAYESAGFVIRGETTWSRDGRTLQEYVMVRRL